jgi:hypothetical protein
VSTFSTIEIGNKTNTLFVLPELSLPPKRNETHAAEDMLPLSKRGSVNMVKEQQMDQFYNAIFKGGHGPTQYDEWLKKHQHFR